MRILSPCGYAIILFLMTLPTAHAGFMVSNWSIVGDTVSFDISGDIEAGAMIGAFSSEVLYIGIEGDNDWISANGNVTSVTNNGGGSRDIHTDLSFYNDSGGGDYVQLHSSDLAAWTIGDTVDASVSISGGTLIGSNINANDLIVTAGFDVGSPFPDATNQVGAFAAAPTTAGVPEPSSLALLGVGALGWCFMKRRRRSKQV